MSTFRHAVEIGDSSGQRFERVEALIDTGATYSVFPASQLRSLGVTAVDRIRLMIGDGSSIEREVGEARVRLDGREATTMVVFGDAQLPPVLGAYSLEGLRLMVDPFNQRLIPIQGFLPFSAAEPGVSPR